MFNATITGVTFNPWWEVPASIVHESIGALVRRSPKTAAARGYVWGSGRYRQRPAPNNALSQMKLVMPNPYSVYMHDTPSKELFEEDVRAFSHGCIRTGDALNFAATLLDDAESPEDIAAVVGSGETTTIDLPHPVPDYVAYFTAVDDGKGGVRLLPDVYGRDARGRRREIAPSPIFGLLRRLGRARHDRSGARPQVIPFLSLNHCPSPNRRAIARRRSGRRGTRLKESSWKI